MGLNDYTPGEDTYKSKLKAEQAKRTLAAKNILDFAVAFSNFNFKVDEFHAELAKLLDDFLIAVEQGKHPILVIYAPPRSGKTQLVVRALVPTIFGRHPEWEVIVATHTHDLAANHGRDIREIMTDPYYDKVFPGVSIDKNKAAADNFSILGKRGQFKGVGSAGNVTGSGANVFICDDLVKDMADARSDGLMTKIWEWLQAVASTRLDPDNSGLIVMATRWSEIDPTGRLLDSNMADEAIVFGYSALNDDDESNFPKRMPTKWLLNVRKNLDPKIWSSLYQGKPVAEDGLIFKSENINITKKVPKTKDLRIYITGDPAASSSETSDFWTYVVWGVDHEDNLYMLDWYHKRGIDSLTYLRSLFKHCDQYKPSKVFLERCHASNVLEPIINKMMREERKYYSFEYPSPGNKDKMSRSTSIAARMSQGKVYIKDFDDVATVTHELLAFPDGKHDDIVDCFSMMGRVMDTTVTAAPPVLPDVPVNTEFNWEKATKNRVRSVSKTPYARRPRSLF